MHASDKLTAQEVICTMAIATGPNADAATATTRLGPSQEQKGWDSIEFQLNFIFS